MSSIPIDALQFGARSMAERPVSFDKTRVSGSTRTSYILHSKGGCMPGQKDIFTINARSNPGTKFSVKSNRITRAFQIERYSEAKVPSGIRYPKTFRDNYTFEEYAPHDDDSREVAIHASYRQIFGNFMPMESERPIEPERRLRNGDITIREFIRLIAKSTFYKKHYFENVNQQRFIELCYKHFLGRPPLDQQEIIFNIEAFNNVGFDEYIDGLIDSLEYQEVFGECLVPYQRCWDSPCGVRTSSFINTASLTRSFATSDNAIHSRGKLTGETNGRSKLLHNLASRNLDAIVVPSHTKFLTMEKEKSRQVAKEESIMKQEVSEKVTNEL